MVLLAYSYTITTVSGIYIQDKPPYLKHVYYSKNIIKQIVYSCHAIEVVAAAAM